MFDLLSIIPGRKRISSNGWHSFNAVCCHHRGHKPDRRRRGGIKIDGPKQVYHCFNCGFAGIFTLGETISKNVRTLLIWCGIDELQIQRWSLESLQKKDILDVIYSSSTTSNKTIPLKVYPLPKCELLTVNNPSHKRYIDYIQSRKINLSNYSFMVTPTDIGRNSNRIIIPYTYKNNIVGYTSRFLDDQKPKYVHEHEPGYVFGIDFQKPSWSVCLVVEGIFDALSLNACAIMHNTINNKQALLLSQLNRPIIVVPDQDASGLELCERALDLGYKVSLPMWEPGVKDVNDAVVKYGKLATLRSILQSATHSRIKIQLRKTAIAKRL